MNKRFLYTLITLTAILLAGLVNGSPVQLGDKAITYHQLHSANLAHTLTIIDCIDLTEDDLNENKFKSTSQNFYVQHYKGSIPTQDYSINSTLLRNCHKSIYTGVPIYLALGDYRL